MAYGSVDGVAGFAGTWTTNGKFLDPDVYQSGTHPTLEQVENWLDELSVMMNLALANEGFIVPVTQAEVIKALGMKVEVLTADLVNLANNSGRLYSERIQESGTNPMTIIDRDIHSWIKSRTAGFEAMGVPRIVSHESQQSYSVPSTRQL